MKKLISFVLSAAMALSVMSPLAATVYAEEVTPPENEAAVITGLDEGIGPFIVAENTTEEESPASVEGQIVEEIQVADESEPDQGNETDENPEQEGSAVETVAQLFAALPASSAVADMTDEELAAALDAMQQAMEAFDALPAEELNAFIAKYPDLYHAVVEDLTKVLAEASGKTDDALSIRPIPQTTDVYLTLTGYTKEQLQAFPVDQILTMLTDSKGEKIEVDTGYTNAWFYFRAEDFDEYHALNSGETIDLWYYLSGWGAATNIDTDYGIYMVLGKGSQLDDAQNHRYVITVELDTNMDVSGWIDYRILGDNEATGSRYSRNKNSHDVFDALNMQGVAVDYYYRGSENDSNRSLKFSYSYSGYVGDLDRNGIQLDVYPMESFLAYRDSGAELTGAITDQIFSEEGYKGNFDTVVDSSNYKNASNLFCITFTNKETGRLLGYAGFLITVKPYEDPIIATLWAYQNGEMKKLNSNLVGVQTSDFYYNVNFLDPNDTYAYIRKVNTSSSVSAWLADDYSEDDDFFFTLQSGNTKIKAVYEGNQSGTLEYVAQNTDAKEITKEVLYDGTQAVPYGYRGKFSNYRYFTIYLDDEYNSKIIVGADVYNSTYSKEGVDPYFSIQETYIEKTDGDGNTYVYEWVSDYSPYNAGGVPLDTYYRRDDKYDVGGYQVLFVQDGGEAVDLKKLIPVFWTPEGVQVNSGAKVESGKTNLQNVQWSEAMANTVEYQVSVPGQSEKNYRVTFLTQQEEPTLFVGGPDERFVNLTADNNYVHDVLITNVGKEDLTGLKVELIDPVHIKLDEYWAVGGAGNDTLPAFETMSHDYIDENGERTYESGYATLPNITKIRLLADGEGDISGTLRVTAANGQQRDIKLTGIAANPHITSAALDDAVKYVPYSYMIATDNMYNWNRASYKITEGALPEGMYFYEETGEIYGVPQETGSFTFTVEVTYSSSRFSPSVATFTLNVNENSNLNVYNESDEGYSIKTPLGVEQGTDTRDFLLSDTSTDQLYVSNGVYPEFIALWLNGKRLVRNEDYTVESGSTRITIKSQTFADKCDQNAYNTIAAEFRVDGDWDNELKRTAQNFRLRDIEPAPGDTGSDPADTPSDGGTGGSDDGGSDDGGSDDAAPDNTDGTVNPADTTGATGAAGAAAASAAARGVTLRCYLVDENDEALPGMTVELHSTPRSGVTDKNGLVVFSRVEFGAHTLTVKDANGSVLATKSFELASGPAGITGDKITAMGGSALAITVKLENGGLSFARVTANPQTGDSFDPKPWMILVMLSGVCLLGMVVYKKKKDQEK